MEGIKVLSLFDGISCGQVALRNLGIPVSKYYASEIENSSISITQRNFPNTVQLGDVRDITSEQLDGMGNIDLLIGGSPCQDLSSYKQFSGDNLGLLGDKSRLFYEYVRILNHVKPKYFMLENVGSMKAEWVDLISEILRVTPLLINSSKVTAAERKRYYWTNIDVEHVLEGRDLSLEDIVIPSIEVPDKYWYDKPFEYRGDDCKVQCVLAINGHRHMKEVYNLKGKCNTLACDGDGGNRQKKVYQDGRCRKLTPLEYERLQTLPDGYTEGVSDSKRYSAIGNGWTVDVVSHIFKGMNLKEGSR